MGSAFQVILYKGNEGSLNYITIDAGTTNTRAKVWRNDAVISEASVEVGVRNTAITGSKNSLQQGVKKTIDEACSGAGISPTAITAILASGMITSELGLYELPHLVAPAGIDELAAGMTCSMIPEVAELPIWFIPGIKNSAEEVTLENCEQMDMMRGEETEAIGTLCQLSLTGEALCVLPGSHTKFLAVDSAKKIRGCLTTLTGELLGVITHNTILSNALKHSFAEKINETALLKGAYYAQRVGVGRTCFTLRILDRFTDLKIEEKANFLLGAMLSTDLAALKSSSALSIHPETPVVIMGNNLFKAAFTILFKNDSYFTGHTHVLPSASAADIAGYGALAIAKRRGIVY